MADENLTDSQGFDSQERLAVLKGNLPLQFHVP